MILPSDCSTTSLSSPTVRRLPSVFDFDKKGIVNGFMLDANLKKQNPAAVKLVDWLRANAGKPTVKKKGSATWTFGGWKIEHDGGRLGRGFGLSDRTHPLEMRKFHGEPQSRDCGTSLLERMHGKTAPTNMLAI